MSRASAKHSFPLEQSGSRCDSARCSLWHGSLLHITLVQRREVLHSAETQSTRGRSSRPACGWRVPNIHFCSDVTFHLKYHPEAHAQCRTFFSVLFCSFLFLFCFFTLGCSKLQSDAGSNQAIISDPTPTSEKAQRPAYGAGAQHTPPLRRERARATHADPDEADHQKLKIHITNPNSQADQDESGLLDFSEFAKCVA